MNLIDQVVVEVLGPPEFFSWDDGAVTYWLVRVRKDGYGFIDEGTLSFPTEEEALTVKPGYKFVG